MKALLCSALAAGSIYGAATLDHIGKPSLEPSYSLVVTSNGVDYRHHGFSRSACHRQLDKALAGNDAARCEAE